MNVTSKVSEYLKKRYMDYYYYLDESKDDVWDRFPRALENKT